MKGKIDEAGGLMIERAGKLVTQYCMFQHDEVKCGDYCPLFGEAEMYSGGGIVPSGLGIKICQDRVLHFEELADERSS